MSPGDSNAIKPATFEHVAGICIENGDFDMSESMTQLLARLAEVTAERDRLAAELQKLREQEPVVQYMARRLTPEATKEMWGYALVDDLQPGAVLFAAPVAAPAVPDPRLHPEWKGRNEYGLDMDYFRRKLEQVLRDLNRYTPEEFARAMAVHSRTADESVIAREFVPAPSVPEEWRVFVEIASEKPWVSIATRTHWDERMRVQIQHFRCRVCNYAWTEDEREQHHGGCLYVKARAMLQSADHSERSLEMVTPELSASAKDQGICDHD